jgi:hypothetical protein
MKVDFYTLPRTVQDRFLASARGAALPAPIMFVPASRRSFFTWLGAASGLALMAFVVARIGLGDVESSVAMHGPAIVAIYALLFAGGAYGLVRALEIYRAQKSLPWVAGIYVFPACIVDASSHKLRVWSMQELADVTRTPTPVNTFHFVFAGGQRVSLPVKDLDLAERTEHALAVARAHLADVVADPAKSIAALDPLHDAAISSPLAPTQPLKREVPMWARFGWVAAAAFGFAVGPLLGLARNGASDAKMFDVVTDADSIDLYKRYLAQGGKRSADVRDVLLPRAELREAEKALTVESIQAFAKAHPKSKIQGEIDVALRKRLVWELDKAKRDKTVASLDAFAKRYPDHKLDGDLRAAKHVLYANALKAYKEKAPDADAAAAMERVLAFAEKNGPAFEVRVRMRASKSLSNADAAIEKNRYFAGKNTLPSRYFERARLDARETAIAQPLVDEIKATFPADILAPKMGAKIDDGDLPRFTVPTLLVDYGVEWSHVQVASTKPRGAFAGVNVPFEASMQVPDGSQPYKVRQSFWRPSPEPWRYKDIAPGELADKVYDTMTDAIFESMKKKAYSGFFASPKKS